MRVEQVCEIQSGFTARERLSEHPLGVPALQLRDLNETDDWNRIEPGKYALGDIHPRYFAGPEDILFRSRGARNTASVIPADWQYLVVVIQPLLLLKPDCSTVRPEYLAWAINHPETQRELDKGAQGASLRMISKKALAELDIDVPGLATQDAILAASRLAEHTKHLETRAADLRHSLTSMVLREAASRAAGQNNDGARS